MQRYLALLERATIQVMTDNVQFHVTWIDREKSILLSQEFHFILGAEQTPDFLPCPRVTQSNAIPLILENPWPTGTVTLPWLLLWSLLMPRAGCADESSSKVPIPQAHWGWVTRFHTVPVSNPKFIWKHSISSSTKYCLHAGWEAGRWWHFTLQLARECHECHAVT